MSYKKLLTMTGINFLVMWALTYAAVASFSHIHLNINRAYMAAIMAAPMVLLKIAMTGEMYENKKALRLIFASAAVVFIAGFIFIRQQTFVGNEQFLRSMIPHHSSAILMCEQSAIDDPEIIDLCDSIVETQKEEIAIMERMLEEGD